MEIKRMSLDSCNSMPLPWIHGMVHPGIYGSMLTELQCLRKGPTLNQFRRDSYQGVNDVLGIPLTNYCREHSIDYETFFTLIWDRDRTLRVNDIPCYSSDLMWNRYKIREVEERTLDIGHPVKVLGGGVTATNDIDIRGKLDSLIVIPDAYIASYTVKLNGTPIFAIQLKDLDSHIDLVFTLLVFRNGQLSYVKISDFSKHQREQSALVNSLVEPVFFVNKGNY